MAVLKQMTVGPTVITVMHNMNDGEGNPCLYLMIEDEDGEINLDLSPDKVDELVALLKPTS